MKNNFLYILLGFILGLIIYFLFINSIFNPKQDKIQKITVKDTVIGISQPEPIIMTKTKMKIIEKRDTIIQIKPFHAQVDTIIRMDTITLCFDFPENEFSLSIHQKPDSLLLREIITEPPPPESSFWDDILKIAGGAFLGIIIGLALN